MIKLSSSNNIKKIVLASSLLIAPTLAFSGEMNERQGLLTNEQLQILQEMNEYIQEGNLSTDSIESKSKQGSQALIGEWNVSYTYQGSRSDKLVIDGTDTMDDGEIYSVGSYYADQTGGEIPILCVDYKALYSCMAAPASGDYVGFLFTLSGDRHEQWLFCDVFFS